MLLKRCYFVRCSPDISLSGNRFREFLRRSPVSVPTLSPARDPDYYNDLPGKIPPEPALKVRVSNPPWTEQPVEWFRNPLRVELRLEASRLVLPRSTHFQAPSNNNNTTATTPNNNSSAAGHVGAGENLIDLENTDTAVDPSSVQPIHGELSETAASNLWRDTAVDKASVQCALRI